MPEPKTEPTKSERTRERLLHAAASSIDAVVATAQSIVRHGIAAPPPS